MATLSLKSSDDEVDDNSVVTIWKLGYQKSKALPFSKMWRSDNIYEMENLSPLQSVKECVHIIYDNILPCTLSNAYDYIVEHIYRW